MKRSAQIFSGRQGQTGAQMGAGSGVGGSGKIFFVLSGDFAAWLTLQQREHQGERFLWGGVGPPMGEEEEEEEEL